MAKIQVLPEVLAHQIAAGEIVERPASVVKELLENSLDAGASRITVEAQEGGKKRITVRDDGLGMDAEDARLAFQRHATSKIRRIEDLSGVETLGFRGEALPSIASVSRLQLRTIERGTSPLPRGTLVEFEGGLCKGVREVAWPRGTEVVVEDLFFNVPARRQFLKTTSTELGHVTRQVLHYALAYPQVEFQFTHQKRPLLEAPPVATHRERIFQVLGEAFLDDLVPISYRGEGLRVEGFVSLPHEQRTTSHSQFFFVNRRMVRDRVLAHALRNAYQDRIPSRSYPVAILFIDLDPTQVDVNVHPSKTEIRFRNSRQVHAAVEHAIEEALLGETADFIQSAPVLGLHSASAAQGAPGNGHNGAALRVAESVSRFFQRHARAGRPLAGWEAGRATSGSRGLDTSLEIHHATGLHHPGESIPVTDYLSETPVAVGQFVESFVLATDREGILLVDQHVAHERILYEQALGSLASSQGCAAQRLLIPLTYDLSPHQKAGMAEILRHLNANGFEVEWFGPETVVIRAVPAFAGDCDARLLVEEILDGVGLEDEDSSDRDTLARRLREKIAITASCRAAIKINTPLSEEKMQWLLDELFRCQNPFTCPHGRPILLRMGIEEILKGFHRI